MTPFWKKRDTLLAVLIGMLTVALLVNSISTSFAQEGDMAAGLGDDAAPAPASIGADVPLTYFGPPPSEFQKELIGPFQLLKAGKLDQDAGTITLPLYKGQLEDGTLVWYVLTDTTDQANASALGLVHSAKLQYARVGRGARQATLEADGSLTFANGTVDFSPE
ncbi:MAG: hypothetical protein M3Q45_04980, partial [Chloroflexota bacterium]|nr:hypothetical protein [Chloroflexota bacterium]